MKFWENYNCFFVFHKIYIYLSKVSYHLNFVKHYSFDINHGNKVQLCLLEISFEVKGEAIQCVSNYHTLAITSFYTSFGTIFKMLSRLLQVTAIIVLKINSSNCNAFYDSVKVKVYFLFWHKTGCNHRIQISSEATDKCALAHRVATVIILSLKIIIAN